MHLKRLLLTGFKTFAEKTEIEFSPGVTAIVGPNGSGKSNIADAVLWVLGEQKASAVRGTKTQDVIFAGSAKRKPLGLAEVSLTVDNTDRTLPLGFDEVTITRRAYRSGEGEYFLNKTPCRLKDIYELFLDTGVGREAYALVNQSEIDAVLSADPEVRRGLFEEAAGIKKYRVKKREALKKLEAAEANLVRVRDILCEIECQIDPLRAQAESATRYLSIKERLGRIELDHLIAELRLADYETVAARQAREEEEAALAAHASRLAAAEERASELAGVVAKAEERLETARANHQSALTAVEQARSRRELALQRMEGLSAQLALYEQELADLEERLARANTQLGEAQSELSMVRSEEAELAGKVREQEQSLAGLDAQIAELRRRESDLRVRAQSRERQRAARRDELARAEAQLAQAEAALPAIASEVERAEVSLGELRAALSQAQKRRDEALRRRERAEEALRQAALARERALAALNTARQERDRRRSETLALSARRRSLIELEEAQEGYYAGVRAVLRAAQRREFPGIFVVVADSFTAPPGYETAFEVALASSLQDIITDTEESAKRAIEYLKRAQAGRATFLPLDRMRPAHGGLRVGQAQRLSGYLGTALAILDFDERYRPALEVLLGRVLVCSTLDDSLQVSSLAQGWSRIVTLGGELVLPSGALTGGSLSRKGAPILERKTEIAALAVKLTASELLDKECEAEFVAVEEAVLDTDLKLAQAQQEASAVSLALAGIEQEIARIERELAYTEQRAAEYRKRLEQAGESLAQLGEKVALCQAAMGEEPEGEDEAVTDQDAEELRRALAERDGIAAEATSLRIALAALSERAAGHARAERAAVSQREEIETGLARRREREALAREELGRLTEVATNSETIERQAAAASGKAGEELARAQQEYHGLREREQEAQASARLIGEMRAAALERIRKSELAEARSEMQRAQLAARLLEEYDVTAEYALSLDQDPEVPEDTPREVARLRRELRSLGEVNTGAAEEFARLSERHNFLLEQKTDLEEAREKIVRAIREIDESTREVFMEAFRAVGVAFDEIFRRLFDGGATELALTRPDDLLETGVEVIAQPPGKKKQNLSLLSGGERALTAAALLFAFLKVRPAPFCLLDEVDAPLDGANVERFADLLRDFGLTSQFLVITHNPTTMEAAPIWYGVTMQEPGISQILSLQVPQAVAS